MIFVKEYASKYNPENSNNSEYTNENILAVKNDVAIIITDKINKT